MRFEKIIKEAAEFQIAVKDIESKMHELYRVLKKHSFQMTDKQLENTLDGIFSDKRIIFGPGKKNQAHFSHLLDGAGITKDLGIIVEYVPGFSKYFRRFAREEKYSLFFDVKKNEFFRSLAEVITHEYRHYFQAIASKSKSMKVATNPTKLGEFEGYYADPHELDAFALQAAIQTLRFGESNVIGQYQGYFKEDNPKIWRKFVKKTNAQIKNLRKRGLEKYIKLR